MSRAYFLLVLSPFLFESCQKENSQSYPVEFEEYVDEFFLQGNQRNQNLNLEDFDFTIEFGQIEESNVVGRCNNRNNIITIDSLYWDRSNTQKREWLIFHELGHCILDRDHQNDKTESGECLSIMKGVENDFECSYNYYSSNWREYYLDELFSATKSLPNWYLSSKEYSESTNSNEPFIQIQDTLVEQIVLDSIELDLYDEFLVEIEFANYNTDENLVQFTIGDLTFGSCDICISSKIRIYSGNGSTIYYSTNGINFNSDIKLSIIKNKDIICFLVNEKFIHSMESKFLDGNLIKTNRFDELLEVDINISLD